MKTQEEIIESFKSFNLEKSCSVYIEQCYPHDIPLIQRTELHKTFFAGALVMYGMMLHSGDFEEKQALEFLDYLQKQLEAVCHKPANLMN